MNKLNFKKVIGISAILIVIVFISLLTYGKNKSNVFKDEYMNNIFIDEDTIDLESINESDNNEYLIENIIKEDKNINSLDSSNNIIVVEIKGEVLRPDVYELNEGSIVKELIEAAGGLTSEADISNINRAKEVKNHELVIIRNINDMSNVEEHDNIIEIEEDNDGVVSINDADLSKLKEIPGIGDVKANAIIMYREKNGGFKSIEELKNVDGIGEKTFEKIKDSIKL
ncbi:helix-hairpin-helix domain-containing protein [Clostridioides difficile]